MLQTLIIVILSATFGFVLCGLVSQRTIAEGKALPQEPQFCYTSQKLKRHDLHVGILIERYATEPEATLEKVADEFSRQLSQIIKENIVIQEDRKRGFVMFDMSLWTKERDND